MKNQEGHTPLDLATVSISYYSFCSFLLSHLNGESRSRNHNCSSKTSSTSMDKISPVFVLQADDVHALLQDAMPPAVQPPSLTKSSINLGNSSDASSNNSVTFNASDLGVAAGASGNSAGASMSLTAEGCNMERTMAEGERSIDSMSVSAFLNSVGLEQLVCVFEKEQISMDILVEMGHDELKEVGINAYGHRHKILKGLEKLAASKGQNLSKKPAMFHHI
jgi:hypothetical protein